MADDYPSGLLGTSPVAGGLLTPAPAPTVIASAPKKPKMFRGQVVLGNIDLAARPVVHNPDGSISTVRSMSIGTDQGEVLIPMVSDDGRLLTEDQAIGLFYDTGRHLGIFRTPDAATAYAKRLHNQQAKMYGAKR
jgi:hypothetical protein